MSETYSKWGTNTGVADMVSNPTGTVILLHHCLGFSYDSVESRKYIPI